MSTFGSRATGKTRETEALSRIPVFRRSNVTDCDVVIPTGGRGIRMEDFTVRIGDFRFKELVGIGRALVGENGPIPDSIPIAISTLTVNCFVAGASPLHLHTLANPGKDKGFVYAYVDSLARLKVDAGRLGIVDDIEVAATAMLLERCFGLRLAVGSEMFIQSSEVSKTFGLGHAAATAMDWTRLLARKRNEHQRPMLLALPDELISNMLAFLKDLNSMAGTKSGSAILVKSMSRESVVAGRGLDEKTLYGIVWTDPAGRVVKILEKPTPRQIFETDVMVGNTSGQLKAAISWLFNVDSRLAFSVENTLASKESAFRLDLLSEARRLAMHPAQSEIDITSTLARMIESSNAGDSRFDLTAVESRALDKDRRDIGGPNGLSELLSDESSPFQPFARLRTLTSVVGSDGKSVLAHMIDWATKDLKIEFPEWFERRVFEISRDVARQQLASMPTLENFGRHILDNGEQVGR